MEEAQRLLTVSVWKLYRCRLQRGGLRLHRSLQLSLLVRAARHRYLSARAAAEPETSPGIATGDLMCAPAPNPGVPSIRPTRDPSIRPVPDPRSVRDRGDPPNPHRADSPSLMTPYRGDQDIHNASDRGHLPSPDPTNRDPPQDSPNRDLPSAAGATPPPEPLKPLGPLPVARAGRKRRSSGSAGDGQVPVPSKRARLEAEEPPLPPGGPPGRCLGPLPTACSLLIRAVGAC